MTRLPLSPERASELPSPLAPKFVARPHTHQYVAASRVTGSVNWGPQQVSGLPAGQQSCASIAPIVFAEEADVRCGLAHFFVWQARPVESAPSTGSRALTCAARVPAQGVMKLSVPPEWGAAAPAAPDAVSRALWFPDDRAAFAQEPIFVPRRGGRAEDDGWVLTLVYSASCHRTSLVRAAMQGLANAFCAVQR